MKKYFNPLKPDSARITYKILPPEYANPYVEPRPISIKVEIKDNTGFTVYGERELTNQEKEKQILFWDGRDNYGDTVNLEQGPFEAELNVYYREIGLRLLWGCARKTSLYPTEFNLIAFDYENNEVPEDEEVAPGAFVHFNLDNDNRSDNSIAGPEGRHPGGDYLEDGPVGDEDDLKLAKIEIKPFFETGRVELKRDNTNIRVWSCAVKGANEKVLYDNDVKIWNLAIPSERQEFESLKDNLYVEGYAKGDSRLFIWFYDKDGNRWTGDLVKYHFIAADCEKQPRTDVPPVYVHPYAGEFTQWGYYAFQWDSLVGCECSIIEDSDKHYNCWAWTVGMTHRIVTGPDPEYIQIDSIYQDPPNSGFWYINIDWFGPNTREGYLDNVFDVYDFNAFYDEYGYEHTNNEDEAEIMLYKAESEAYWNPIVNPMGFTHGALRRHCICGVGRWVMYESKIGEADVLEHRKSQLNGDDIETYLIKGNYGFPFKYYKKQE